MDFEVLAVGGVDILVAVPFTKFSNAFERMKVDFPLGHHDSGDGLAVVTDRLWFGHGACRYRRATILDEVRDEIAVVDTFGVHEPFDDLAALVDTLAFDDDLQA